MNALLIGDSFISRLQRHHNARNLTHHNRTTNSKKLRVSSKIKQVIISGKSGLTVKRAKYPEKEYAVMDVTCVIVNLGSNDIANGVPPLNVAMNLIEYCTNLLKMGAERVYINSILHRGHKAVKNFMEFNTNVDLCNRILKDMCCVESNLHYFTLRGFWTKEPSEWSNDELHPRMNKFTQEIRSLFSIASH